MIDDGGRVRSGFRIETTTEEFEQVGAAAMRVLLDDLAGRAGVVHLRIPPVLVPRDSVAPPR